MSAGFLQKYQDTVRPNDNEFAGAQNYFQYQIQGHSAMEK